MNRIKEVRKDAGLTQQQLASAVGMSYQAIQNYETGLREPHNFYWQRMADRLGVSTEYLKGLSDDKGEMKAALNISQEISIYVKQLGDALGTESGREVYDAYFKLFLATVDATKAIKKAADAGTSDGE